MNSYFNGPFAAQLHEFVEFKRGMGFKYQKERTILKQFSEFTVAENTDIPVLT